MKEVYNIFGGNNLDVIFEDMVFYYEFIYSVYDLFFYFVLFLQVYFRMNKIIQNCLYFFMFFIILFILYGIDIRCY